MTIAARFTIALCAATFVWAPHECRSAQPPADAGSWFASRAAGDEVRNFDGRHEARKVRLDGISRNAVPAGADMTWTTALGEADALDVAMGVLCLPRSGPCGAMTAFEVRAEVEGESVKILHRSEIHSAAFSRWHLPRVDLSALGGKTVKLHFVVSDPSAGGAARKASMPLWGEPLLVRSQPAAGPNVILISLDTLRADRLGCYGYDREISPNLDALAREGVRFDQAISQAPWTTPAHASIFTSLHPSSHKVAMPLAALSSRKGCFLAPEITTLAEILRGRGMRTEAVTGGGTMSSVWGFDQGFDHYQEFATHYGADRLSPPHGERFADLWQAVVARLAAIQSVPFFLFLHTFEIHAPYLHLEYARPLLEERQYAELSAIASRGRGLNTDADLRRYLEREGLMRKEVTSALYDGGVRFVDEQLIGPLIGQLEAAGIYQNTIVVVTSDHGEEFGEHHPGGIYGTHGGNLYDTLIRVPLIIRAPGDDLSAREVRQQVRSIDIAPTILDLLDIAVPEEMEGRSLVPLMRGTETGEPPPAVSEATSQGPEWKSIRDGRYKLLYVVETKKDDDAPRVGLRGEPIREYLFDVSVDPGEQDNIAVEQDGRKDELARELRSLLLEFAGKTIAETSTQHIDDGVMERLRALGYVE